MIDKEKENIKIREKISGLEQNKTKEEEYNYLILSKDNLISSLKMGMHELALEKQKDVDSKKAQELQTEKYLQEAKHYKDLKD